MELSLFELFAEIPNMISYYNGYSFFHVIFIIFMTLGYIPFAYLLGSIPFGFILTKILGKGDIRQTGSGNIGATNVLRAHGKPLAFATLCLDFLKPVPPIIFAFIVFRDSLEDLHLYLTLIGLCAIIGHCYPVWLKFKGGKGVATTLGVLLAALPWAGFVACVTWGIVAGFFRISSLSALVAVAFVPLTTLLIYGAMPALVTILIAMLVFWRHKENIKRLLKGVEPKIGTKN